MDTRKLVASGNAEEIRTEDGNMVATTDNRLVDRTVAEKQAIVRELVRRYNAFPEAIDRIHDLIETAKEVENMMDGDKDKQEAWTEELGRLYAAIDEARALLETIKA